MARRPGTLGRTAIDGTRERSRSHAARVTRAGRAFTATLAVCGLGLPAGIAAQDAAVAFVGVTVIPMDRERSLADHTVVVRDGRIAAVGPSANTPVPEDATRVDGQGRYLIPGLAEMHGHVPPLNAQGNRQYVEDVLFLYVAAGATTVRGMQGHPSQLEMRDRVDARSLIGPRLVLAGPQLSGNSAPDAATATQRVHEQHEAGFDLLKIQEGLSPAAYDAIVSAARQVDLPFGGHVPDPVGLRRALAAGQSTVDHLDNYVATLRAEGDVTDASITALARATREAGVAVVPTMSLWETLLGAQPVETLQTREELRYMPAQTVQSWANSVRQRNPDPVAGREEVAIRNRMLAAMDGEGVTILMGTDAPQLFSVPGFSLFREIRSMADAGMGAYAILHSGTLAVARFLGLEAESGTIAAGKRADLILLDADPLADITNVELMAGVVVNGRWLPESEIQQRLSQIAARAAGSP